MKYLYLIFIFTLVSCSTVATQSEDGLTLKIKGSGSAEFGNGAKIQGGTYIPQLPKIELDS